MPLVDPTSGDSLPPRHAGVGPRQSDAGRTAFLGAIAGVLVDEPVHHVFLGAIERELAAKIWTWMARDIAPSPVARLEDAISSGADAIQAFDAVLPEILEHLKANAGAELADTDLERRNTIQMGGEAARKRLAPIIMAMRRRPLLEQAEKFGRAVGVLTDEAALAPALQTITISNPVTRALWMQVMVGHMSNPSRAMAAAAAISDGRAEKHIIAADYGALVDATLSHAQSQIGKLASQPSVFSDVDFACKAIDRFHRLMRAINYNLDIERRSVWGTIIADLTGKISARLERPLREVTINVTQALRRAREGVVDRVDPERVLEGLNGLYLLITVRNSRDSLAVNALLDQAWSETGQAIEAHVTRALDAYRSHPGDAVARERIDAGIKMAEIRFNAEYAEILRRARDGAERRTAQS